MVTLRWLYATALVGACYAGALSWGAEARGAVPPDRAVFTIEALDEAGHATWLLWRYGGDLLFQKKRWATLPPSGVLPEPKTPTLPVPTGERERWFFRAGANLCAWNKSTNPRTGAEEAGPKHGWYFSGDYSTSPPRIVLTKEPTTFSTWTFSAAPFGGDDEGWYVYIRNENDKGKDAWLGMAEKGAVYGKGWEGRAAVLSFEKKARFFLMDVINAGK